MKADSFPFETTPELDAWLVDYPAPLTVYGYTVYPDAAELHGWCDDDPSWRSTWWPLSSSYHPTVFFYDTESGLVQMLSGFRDLDEEGLYVDPVPVYESLDAFNSVVQINARHLNTTAAFLLPEDETYSERLDPDVANAIQTETSAINGPSILPFFFGTLRDFDPLADPATFALKSW